MSSQVSVSGNCVKVVQSYVCGFYAYVHVWEPTVGEVLTLKREPTNNKDRLAVAITKDECYWPYSFHSGTISVLFSYESSEQRGNCHNRKEG